MERPEPDLPFNTFDSQSEAESHMAGPSSTDAAQTSASKPEFPGKSGMVTYQHESASESAPEQAQQLEELSDNMFEYNPSPIALRAVPILPTEHQAQDYNVPGLLNSEYTVTESSTAEAASESASASTDTEEEDEGSLLMDDISPDELCRSVTNLCGILA